MESYLTAECKKIIRKINKKKNKNELEHYIRNKLYKLMTRGLK